MTETQKRTRIMPLQILVCTLGILRHCLDVQRSQALHTGPSHPFKPTSGRLTPNNFAQMPCTAGSKPADLDEAVGRDLGLQVGSFKGDSRGIVVVGHVQAGAAANLCADEGLTGDRQVWVEPQDCPSLHHLAGVHEQVTGWRHLQKLATFNTKILLAYELQLLI